VDEKGEIDRPLHLRIHPTMHKNQIPTRTPENQPAFPLLLYGYLFSHPDWVHNISYQPGYVIPYFQVYDREEKESHTNIWYSSFIDVEIEPEVRLQQSSKWSWLMSHKPR